MEKIRNFLSKKQTKTKPNNMTDTLFEHYYFGCNKRTHIAGQMTPVLYPIIMEYTLDVSILDVKRLIDVK